MYSSLLLLTCFGALFGQVLASNFNFTFGSNAAMLPADALQIPDSAVKTACQTNITDTLSKFTACGDDPVCLCSADTVKSLAQTETCMFYNLIATNTKSPSPLAGSNVLLGAYTSECSGKHHNITTVPLEDTALVLPAHWDGLHVSVLPTGGVVVVVGIGAILGLSSLYLLSNLE